jgi:hypothetical protein
VQKRLGMTEEQRRNTLLQETEDVAREDQLFLQEYAGASNMQLDEAEKIEKLNAKFNEQLQRQIDGTQESGFIYQLGNPSSILLSAGLPNLPIELASNRLKNKSQQENHPFALSEMKDLVKSIQKPLAVFRSATHIGSFVVLTEIEHNGKNFVVAIEANSQKGRIEVNSIRSIHYRDSNTNITNWISDGLLEYVDKEKMSEWFSKRQYNSADVRKSFRHAAKVVQNFENPKLPEENFDESADDTRFSIETDEEFENEFGMEEAKNEPIPFENVVGTMKPDEGLREYALRMNAVMNGYSEERMQQIAELVNKRMERGGKWYAKLYRHLYDKYYPLDRLQKALAKRHRFNTKSPKRQKHSRAYC